MFNTRNTFKPRYGKNNSILPLPANFNSITKRKNISFIIITFLIIWYFINPYSWIISLFNRSTIPHYPQQHPYSSRFFIEQNSKYIYPPIEHAPTLNQITPQKLITSIKQGDRTILKSLNYLDNPDPTVQKLKEDDENSKDQLMRVKNFFKNQDKIIYKSKNSNNYPKVIIVTAVDFEKYSVDSLAKIVQNRVDYAHFQKYGIYVRWSQEFIPQLGSFDSLKHSEKSKWIRLFCLRAAMFAFPDAKWFWYLDQDSMILDLTKNIEEILLNENSLNQLMIRDQPLIPKNGVIKTYKKLKSENVKLILTQSKDMIETISFLIKNDDIGKAIIEIWSDNLYFKYANFPYGPDSALTHILQWHPFILSKTVLVPRKSISSDHLFKNVKKPQQPNKDLDYEDGDFVVQWNKCKGEECEELTKYYHSKIKKQKN
ncbi:MNN11 [Candida pseudojiufengensis]|uniref:MNN11 n=1 Tax=Candida pseudojiufengensis TaxID=497109 RepID=UPI002224425D|nr:MNN11 [Candida pseudojiufengensis]KAI5959553.1 MNN11 [Candida pseudojiufengensis]